MGEVTPGSLLDELCSSIGLKLASTENALASQVYKGSKRSPRILARSWLSDPASVPRANKLRAESVRDQFDELIVIFDSGSDYV